MYGEQKDITVQDISCYGQCSITVALPILSTFGYETVILPSAILSSSFKNFTVHDLSDEIPQIIQHWKMFEPLLALYAGGK